MEPSVASIDDRLGWDRRTGGETGGTEPDLHLSMA
jgi:hypothetical protein